MSERKLIGKKLLRRFSLEENPTGDDVFKNHLKHFTLFGALQRLLGIRFEPIYERVQGTERTPRETRTL